MGKSEIPLCWMGVQHRENLLRTDVERGDVIPASMRNRLIPGR